MAKASISLDPDDRIAPVNRRIFGSFVEHLGRCVYDGIYEPTHLTANADGFRTDVMELVRELGTSTIRYPGGNFVSGYKWEDGIGPRENRPVRRDLAWHSIETNQVGVDDFARWCAQTGNELMMALNLGTRGISEALDLLEYANQPSGTALADLRAANGSSDPYNVRMWCLGNEMDGPWQTGHLSAEDYGKLAQRTAAAMKSADENLELVACGSSNSSMPTFGEWERVVLEHTYDVVDFVSAHAYYQERDGDLGSFLASSIDMDFFIDTVVATADHVKHKLKRSKTINISFDEWNVWYIDRYRNEEKVTEGWPYAPRLLEDVYTVADAVVFGNLLITLLRHHDRVTSANLAQLVNVIAPIMTEPGGDAWRQTTFFPFSVMSRLTKGSILRPRISAETYSTNVYGEASSIDAVASFDEETGTAAVYAVNRSQTESMTVQVDMTWLGRKAITESHLLHDDDPYAKNTLQDQHRVRLCENSTAAIKSGVLTVELPPVSWAAVALG